MCGKRVVAMATSTVLALMLGAARHAVAQDAKALYPSMAPLDQYLMEDRNSEIALYETAIKGTNGFVCLVERSWTAPIDDPGFWNPKGRAPVCLNPAAARTYLPRTIKKTDLILAGRTKAQMVEAVAAAVDKKELPPMELGAICYMLSKQGYLSDRVGHWHPHLMFFVSQTDPATWGAGVQGSPILAFNDKWEGLTVFLVPVRQWSDGTADR